MIEISKLTKTYDRGTKALKDVNITIDDGEFVFITGRSGSGKSTLIKILLKEVERPPVVLSLMTWTSERCREDMFRSIAGVSVSYSRISVF